MISCITFPAQGDDYSCYDIYTNSGAGSAIRLHCSETPFEACTKSPDTIFATPAVSTIDAYLYDAANSLCYLALRPIGSHTAGVVLNTLTCPDDQQFDYLTQSCTENLDQGLHQIYILMFTAIAFVMVILGFMSAWIMNRR